MMGEPGQIDYAALTSIVVCVAHLKSQCLGRDLTLVLPSAEQYDVFPGVVKLFGLPVVRANIETPLVGVPVAPEVS